MAGINQTVKVRQRRSLIRALGASTLGGGMCWAFSSAACAQTVELRMGGTGTALATLQLLAQAYEKENPGGPRFAVLPSMGSGGGIKAVLAGALSLAVSSRPLQEAESRAGATGVEYGNTPLAFVVPVASKVQGVSIQELTQYYSGKSDHWPDGSRLRLIMRPAGDSDTQSLKTLGADMAAALATAEQRKGLAIAISDQDAARALETTPGALGLLALVLLQSEQRQLRALALNGVIPSARSVADGSYPLAKPLLLVTGPRTPPEAHAFVRYVRSAAARGLLERTGHWVR